MSRRLLALTACAALALGLGVGLAACGDDDDENGGGTGAATTQTQTTPTQDIVQIGQLTPQLSSVMGAVVTAGLTDTLKGEGPYTVFAPSNEAFAQVDKRRLAQLLKPENRDELAAILTYHVVPGKILAEDLTDGETLETVQGAPLKVSVEGDTVKINTATVVKADIEAANGVIHVIDGVLVLPTGGGGASG